MSDLKRISILVFVLLNVSASIAYRHFPEKIDELENDGERHEHLCAKTETNNELNAIIVDKVLKILELENVEKEKKLQMKTPCNKHRSIDSDGAKIQNQIFVQFFDKNQTSVDTNRQTFQIENGRNPQTPPKIDIGKLNWTDASANFDKDPADSGNVKVTAVELNKILEEIMKHTRCPLGSFYDSKKGCISTSTLDVVPENTNLIDIEAIFNQPLIEAPKTETSVDTEENLVEHKVPQVMMQVEMPDGLKVSEKEAAKISLLLANYLKHKSVVDEGEIPLIIQALKGGALGTEMVQTNAENAEMKIAAPEVLSPYFEAGKDLYELKQELEASGLSIDMEQLGKLVAGVQLQEQGGVQVQADNGMMAPDDHIDDQIMIRPQIYHKLFPVKMMMNLPQQQVYAKKHPPIKFNLPIKFLQQPGMRIQSPGAGSNLANAIMSMGPNMAIGNRGEVVEEKDPEQVESSETTGEENLEMESGEDENAEKSQEPPKSPRRQAFVIHELPLDIGKFQPINEDSSFSDSKTAPRRSNDATTTTTTTAPSQPTQNPGLLGAWINAGTGIVQAHANVLNNLLSFGRQYDEDEIDEDKVRNLVHKNMRRISPAVKPQPAKGKVVDFGDQVDWISKPTKPTVPKTSPKVVTKPTPAKPQTVHVIKRPIAAETTKKPITTTAKTASTVKKPATVDTPKASVKKALPVLKSREFWPAQKDKTDSNTPKRV